MTRPEGSRPGNFRDVFNPNGELTQDEMRALRDFQRRQGERLTDDMTPFSAQETRRLTFIRWLHTENRIAH